jgi:hypothetical protein
MVNSSEASALSVYRSPFTVYLTLCALHLALCVKGAVQSRVLWVRILYLKLRLPHTHGEWGNDDQID